MLGFINYYILQWFFIRLAKHVDISPKKHTTVGWSLIYWIRPLTGWHNCYVILNKSGKMKYLRLKGKI